MLAAKPMNFIPPKLTITSVSDLSQIIRKLQDWRIEHNLKGNGLIQEMFRGQGNEAWELEPKLCRNEKNPEELERIEEQIVREFHRELDKSCRGDRIQAGFLNGRYHSDWLLIQQAQHYELPTRFMDWTIKCEIALFFAVSNPEHDEFNGEFWIYLVPKKNC